MNIWQTIKSILSAMFGVQSSANRERDFAQGRLKWFLILSLDVLVIFMLILFLFVDQIVLR